MHHAEALAWLTARGRLEGASVITSLPDVSELPALGFDGWCAWFEDAAVQVIDHVADDALAVFFQSDVRHRGLWVDKGHLILRAADRARVRVLFHKIVCRKPAGTVTRGRASYSHLIAVSRALVPGLRRTTADVLPACGEMPSKKSMGVLACVDACRFVLDETSTRTIVDPFCGAGTVLAVANAMGLAAVGVDCSLRQCRAARNLRIALPVMAEAA